MRLFAPNWFGLGIFRSGREVHCLEYGCGAHGHTFTGVFEMEPRSCPGFIFRRSVLLGGIDTSPSEFQLFLENLSGKYHGDSYRLTAKNCNHFTDEMCSSLTGKPNPGWVNRPANVGSLCDCLPPESIEATSARHLLDPAYSDDGSISGGSVESDEESDHQLSPERNSRVGGIFE